jgi:hypothetical protein
MDKVGTHARSEESVTLRSETRVPDSIIYVSQTIDISVCVMNSPPGSPLVALDLIVHIARSRVNIYSMFYPSCFSMCFFSVFLGLSNCGLNAALVGREFYPSAKI